MRDTRIDFLRFTGLMMIILAHVYPPPWLFQLRNFDVPLMVFISGLSYRLSVKDESYGSYVWARVQRLVFPVWIFLTCYFVLLAATAWPVDLPSLEKVWRSYALLDGIGYVWVIRIFLLVALLGPLVYRWHLAMPSHRHYLLSVLAAYLLYEVVVWQAAGLPAGLTKDLLQQVVFYAVPYALVFALGLRIPDLSSKAVLALGLLFVATYLAYLGYHQLALGNWLPTQKFKYPPTAYYLGFALMMAIGLYLTASQWMQLCDRLRLTPLVLFVGSNSIWIYLWHILFLQVFKPVDDYRLWYWSVFASAALLTYAQVWLVQQWLARLTTKKSQRLVRTLLTG